MAFRREKDKVADQRHWKQFALEQAALIAEIGIPNIITASLGNWMHFLEHGYFPPDVSDFRSWTLNDEKSKKFVTLLERYFKCGYPYFRVDALGHQRFREELERRLNIASRPQDAGD